MPRRPKPPPAESKKRPLEQLYLDYGQRSFGRTLECRECGFAYCEGEPSDEAAHKAFHRYVTRRKQGGRQSVADGAKSIKSAGSSIRRHNEAMLTREIRELLHSWAPTHLRLALSGRGCLWSRWRL